MEQELYQCVLEQWLESEKGKEESEKKLTYKKNLVDFLLREYQESRTLTA